MPITGWIRGLAGRIRSGSFGAVLGVAVAWAGTAPAAQFTLSWSDNASNEFGFRVERRIGMAGDFSVIATVEASATSYVDSGLSPGTTYCYRVVAYNQNGLSDPTNEACATTATPTSPPSVVLAVAREGPGSGAVSGPGIDCGTDCSESLGVGSLVLLTATPAPGGVFTGWSVVGCGDAESCTVTVAGGMTVTAAFGLPDSPVVGKAGPGAGRGGAPGRECDPDCRGIARGHTRQALAARPDGGRPVPSGSGPCEGSCVVTASAPTAMGAAALALDPAPIAGAARPIRVVAGAGPSEAPRVRGFIEGGEPTGPEFLAYEPDASGGVFVAMGRVDDEPEPVLVTGSGPGTPGEVRTFRADGTWTGLGFQPYGPSFSGGVRVATCDLDGDGLDEVVTGPGPGSVPTVKLWKVAGPTAQEVLSFPVAGPGMTSGLFVACGDLDGDGWPEVISGRDAGSRPEIRVYSVGEAGAQLRARFLAYDRAQDAGVRVAVTDVDGDGRAEVVAGPGPGASPTVRVFQLDGSTVQEVLSFGGADPSFAGGLFVAGGGWDPVHGGGRVLVTAGPGAPPYVRVLAVSAAMVQELDGFYAGDPGALGGATVGAGR